MMLCVPLPLYKLAGVLYIVWLHTTYLHFTILLTIVQCTVHSTVACTVAVTAHISFVQIMKRRILKEHLLIVDVDQRDDY